jgi:surface polysaccharide O-acyltransferase-like enzyme
VVRRIRLSDVNVIESQPPARDQLAGDVPAHVIPTPDPHPKPVGFERAEPQWMNYGDMIRILGTIVVVIGHASDMMLYQSSSPGSLNGPGTYNWHVLNVWDAFARWAVPIYIMLSGSLLLDPNRVESPSKFYHKRLMRIGVPLVFWSLFFMWVDVYLTGWRAAHDPAYQVNKKIEWTFLGVTHWTDQWQLLPWSTHSFWDWFMYLVFYNPKAAWMNLLRGEPYVHMHFIFRIAGLYAFTPVLRVCLRHVPRRMVVASVITMLALSSADSVANNITGTELSAFARFVPFLGYYLLGYLLRNVVVTGWKLMGCWVGFFASVAALAGGEELLVKHYVLDAGLHSVSGPPSMNMMLYDFLSPVRVIMALFAWIVLVNLFRNPLPITRPGRSIIRFWANTTLGLYLIHPLFRELWYLHAPIWTHPYIEKIVKMTGPSWCEPYLHKIQTVLIQWTIEGINATWPTVWKGVPLVTLLVYVPSLIATIIIMRIPYVRRIAG